MSDPQGAVPAGTPTAAMLLVDAVRTGRDLHGDRPALVDDGSRRTYAELATRVLALATVLAEEGVRPGDRVALLCPNEVGYLEVLLAASRLGAAVVPLNHRLVGPEVAFQVEDADAVLAVVAVPLTALARAGGLLDRRHVLLDDGLDARITTAAPFVGPRPHPGA